MRRENLSWRSFADVGDAGQGEIATRWNLTVTPTFYAIDARGIIRHKWVGAPSAESLDSALESLIEEASR